MNAFTAFFAAREDKAPVGEHEYIQDGLKYCGECHTPRQCKVTMGGREYTMPVLCNCQEEKQKAQESAIEQQREKERIEALKRGIADPKYREMTFEGSDHPLDWAKRYVERFDVYLADNIGLMILGPAGTGKTYAAACIANSLAGQGRTVYMANMLSILDRMADQFDEGRDAFLERLGRVDLLVVDDFGVERSSEFVRQLAYQLIETRYRSGKPLIITSNLTLSDFKGATAESYRTYDRIKEICHPVMLDGESRRTRLANDRYARVKGELGI